MDWLTLSLRIDLAELQHLRAEVDAFGQRHAWTAEVNHAFQLALEECVTNVLRYAFPDVDAPLAACVLVRLGCDGQTVLAEIHDSGRPFNPLLAPPPDLEAPLEEMHIGGWGIHIVRQLMDAVEYRRHEGRNILILTKHLAERPV